MDTQNLSTVCTPPAFHAPCTKSHAAAVHGYRRVQQLSMHTHTQRTVHMPILM